MPTRRTPPAGTVPVHRAGQSAAVRIAVACAGGLGAGLPVVAAVLLAGCATLTETSEQYVMVQTVLDHQPVGGVGCVLSNDVGRWFVTSPGRVKIHKSTKPLAVDCRLNDVWAVDQIDAKQNGSRWGNILLTAGAGQLVDRQTGAGFDYPATLTVLLKRVQPGVQPGAPAPGQPPAQTPPPPPGGSAIY
ncbi:hypothetical protein IP92_00841 [Pseudoduganella flava]|uniref:Uncharacterized protein n=1 Tax=Pseudoduganella flava TaxID=871742 RepID=A0A562Q529_9BURK|nr:hypothetical protein [Pseudoduganella flava]TWI51851.1 hypothetical protein IP92_00841 [Pseudoduganella flava]